MQLTPGVTIERGQTVSRQTIYDLVANAVGGTVAESDLSTEVRSVVAQSSPPTPFPGLVWWDMTDQLLKVYVDVVDGTACSVWCAFGPDRFDVPALAHQSVPWGAAVQLVGDGRRVRLPPDPLALEDLGYSAARWEAVQVVGFNNQTFDGAALSCPTAATNTWFAMAIEGFCWTWRPVYKNSGGFFIAATGNPGFDTLISGINGLSGPSGISEVRGGLLWDTNEAIQTGAGVKVTYSPFRFAPGPWGAWMRSLFVGSRLCRD